MRRFLGVVVLVLAGIIAVPVGLSALRPTTGLRVGNTASSPSPSMKPTYPPTSTASPTVDAGWAIWLWERFDVSTLEPRGQRLELGMPEHSVVSPDGRTLASLTYRMNHGQLDMRGRGRLQLIDVERWTVEATAEVEGWVAPRQYGIVGDPALMTFAGDDLMWVEEIPGETCEPHHCYRLRFWREGSPGPQDGSLLPKYFEPWDLAVVPDGFAVFGVSRARTNDEDVWTSTPRFIVLDREDGTQTTDVFIEEISAGWFQSDGEPRTSHPALAWDLDRQVAYVVDDENAVAVDLRGGTAEAASLTAPTLGSRLLDLFAPAAHAKSAEGISLNADLAPDGSRLYVSGVRTQLLHNEDGELTGQQHVPLGLRVIDTQSLRQVAELDLPVSDVRVAPNGNVLLTGVTDRNTALNENPRQSGLYILDPDLAIRHHVLDGTIVWPRYFLEPDELALSFYDRDKQALRLRVLNLTDGSTAADRLVRARTHHEGFRAGFLARWRADANS